MYDIASELYKEMLETYFDECNELSDIRSKHIEKIYKKK